MSSDEITNLLKGVSRGAPDASARLIDAVYSELHRMAAKKMRAEHPGHTLQPTALVHEAYLRLSSSVGSLEDRAHFFGAAAKAMQLVLVDHARRKRAQKRGGAAARVTLHDIDVASPDGELNVFDVHESVEALERESPELASLVRYRYFVGLTLEQIAEIDGISLATVKRRWTFARAWLHDYIG
jgi:RNA polymerase sigma factor (TIGR02999 family)